ncbi:MAG: murein L,D-transpeptidase [Nocardioidaceae bacterium]|nr:murein L,D-transpeptidase [Nocardioidaceae bacterium]
MHPLRRTACCLLGVAALVLSTAPADAAAGAEKAQRRLNQLGCNAGPADGRIETHTRTAITRFQSANGLAQSGRLTDRTKRRLYAAQQVRCDRRPVPARSATGRRIVVSQRQNYVWLVRADGSVARQGPTVDNPSALRPGTYRAGPKCGRAAKIRDNSDASGRLRLQNFVRFAPCGIGFHRVPQYRSNGVQIHPDWYLGTNAKESHGCLRVSRSMSFAIWGFTSRGTRVVVKG